MDFLALRQQLKEMFRSRLRDRSAVGPGRKETTADDNYGSFFGPSEIVLADRLLQQSKSWDITPKFVQQELYKNSGPGISSKTVTKVMLDVVEKKKKMQSIKYSRDYSCLSSDDGPLPVSGKNTALHGDNIIPYSNTSAISRPGEVLKERDAEISKLKEKTSSKIQSGKVKGSELRRVPVPGKKPVLDGPIRGPDASRTTPGQVYEKPHAKSSKGSEIRRVLGSGKKPVRDGAIRGQDSSRIPPGQVPKKLDARSSKGSEIRQGLEDKTGKKVCPKAGLESLNPGLDKKSKTIPSNVYRKKFVGEKKKFEKRKREVEEDEGDRAIAMIRRMFRYDPTKFSGDYDDKNMEASFADIQKEEKRSLKIARKEDAEELKKIMEEESKEKKKKLKINLPQ